MIPHGERLVRVRMSGPPPAVEELAARLRTVLTVAEESPDYPNRGDPGVRRYLSVLLEEVAGDGC